MGTIFDHPYASSTLGSFLRAFTFGHVRQLDAVASWVLCGLAESTPVVAGINDLVFVDLDDTIIEVHGHSKQGSGYGYSGVGGLNALLATPTTTSAPVIVAQRLRKGACGSPRGAARLVADALATLRRLRATDAAATVLLRADSAFYGHPTVAAAIGAGAQVSVTVRLDPKAKKAITPDPRGRLDADRLHRRDLRRHHQHVDLPGRSRRDPLHRVQLEEHHPAGARTAGWSAHPRPQPPQARSAGHVVRHLAVSCVLPTSTLDTVTADTTHRHHAIIEQIHADLKNSALAHVPSSRFVANAAWLDRAVARIIGSPLAKATTATIRRTLITVPAWIASSARRLTLHLPTTWPWDTAWTELFTRVCGPPGHAKT